MLRAQKLNAPGWHLVKWIKLVQDELSAIEEALNCENREDIGRHLPTLSKHLDDIKEMKFKSIDLEEGWRLTDVSERVENGKKKKTYNWEERTIEDAREDMKSFTKKLNDSILNRSNSIPGLLKKLGKCLDFTLLFDALCGQRTNRGSAPAVQKKLAQVGQQEFS